MKIGVKYMKSAFFRVYWKVVLGIFVVELLLLFLWKAGLLGETCKLNGSAMEQCFFLGMNIDALADSFISIWMIPIVGIVFGLLTPFFAAIWPSVAIWVVVFFFYLKKVQDFPEEPKPDNHVPSVQRAGE